MSGRSSQRTFRLHPAIHQKHVIKWLGQVAVFLGVPLSFFMPLPTRGVVLLALTAGFVGASLWFAGAYGAWYAHIDGVARRVWSPHGERKFDQVNKVSVRIFEGGGAFLVWLGSDALDFCMLFCHHPEEAHSTALWLARVIGVEEVDLGLPEEPTPSARPLRVSVDGDTLRFTDTHLGFPLRRWTVSGRGADLRLTHRGWSFRTREVPLDDVLGVVMLTQRYFTSDMHQLVGTGFVEVLTADGGVALGRGMSDAELAWLARELRERLGLEGWRAPWGP